MTDEGPMRADKHKSLGQLAWGRYPVRTCRSLHHCEICCLDIVLGEPYRDGGYSRRAHVTCTPDETFGKQGR